MARGVWDPDVIYHGELMMQATVYVNPWFAGTGLMRPCGASLAPVIRTHVPHIMFSAPQLLSRVPRQTAPVSCSAGALTAVMGTKAEVAMAMTSGAAMATEAAKTKTKTMTGREGGAARCGGRGLASPREEEARCSTHRVVPRPFPRRRASTAARQRRLCRRSRP